jgi:hypothetical protein
LAIEFIGVGTQAASETNGGACNPPAPSGYSAVERDFGIVLCAGRPTDTAEPSTPSGWTKRTSVLFEIGANDLKLIVFHRKFAAGDAMPTFTVPSSWSGTSAGMSTQLAVYRGVDTTTPFDVADQTTTSAAATTLAAPGITTVTDEAMVLSAVATGDDNALNLSVANSFTLRMSGTGYDTTLGGDHAVGLAEKLQAAFGAVTMPTWNQSVNGSDPWVAITMALRPAFEEASRVTRAMQTLALAGDRGRVTRAVHTAVWQGDRARATRAMQTLIMDGTKHAVVTRAMQTLVIVPAADRLPVTLLLSD